ncbi:hypothetical protein STENM327S_01320 [Streptomyces tendae]
MDRQQRLAARVGDRGIQRPPHPARGHPELHRLALRGRRTRLQGDRAGQFTTEYYDWQIEPVHGKTILQLKAAGNTRSAAPWSPPPSACTTSRSSSSRSSSATRGTHRRVPAHRPADLVTDYATRFPVNVIADMLGPGQGRPRPVPPPGTPRSSPSSATSPATRRSAPAARPAGVRRVHAPDHPGAAREPRRRPAVHPLRRRGRRRPDQRRGHQGVLQPAARGRRRDHRQGDRRHLRQPAGPPRAVGGRARGPHPDPAGLRRDPALHPAGPHDHAADGDRRHAQRRHHPRRRHRHLPDRRRQPRPEPYRDPDRFDITRDDLTTSPPPSRPPPTTSPSRSAGTSASGALLAKAEVDSASTSSWTRARPARRLRPGGAGRVHPGPAVAAGVRSRPSRPDPPRGLRPRRGPDAATAPPA